ncbi:MAG TPA: AtpZ/AtpI family protein [Candidatus Acidoferrales bacterium]|nr:AtpZ/AtpI family protein [Candidatus Acidoferrales bacterium]
MKQQTPLSLAQLGGAGMSIIGTLVVGFAIGWCASRFLHWDWAIPVGIILGFVAGMVSMFRQLSARM